MRSLGLSPKGNQTKWSEGGLFYKKDLFSGEALSEYLSSLILESSNCPVPFITYRISEMGVCCSPSYSPRFSMIPFSKLLDLYLREQQYKERVVRKGGSLFNYWYNKFWLRYSAKDRIDFVVYLFGRYGVSRNDSIKYLTVMVELDTLILNIDRHFNNFGIMWDNLSSKYKPMFIFDNGLSLGVGAGHLGTFKDLLDLRKVKMQPFSSRLKANRECLPDFKLDLDIKEFVRLLELTSPLTPVFLKNSNQFVALKRRFSSYYVTDTNGVNILNYLTEKGL